MTATSPSNLVYIYRDIMGIIIMFMKYIEFDTLWCVCVCLVCVFGVCVCVCVCVWCVRTHMYVHVCVYTCM